MAEQRASAAAGTVRSAPPGGHRLRHRTWSLLLFAHVAIISLSVHAQIHHRNIGEMYIMMYTVAILFFLLSFYMHTNINI